MPLLEEVEDEAAGGSGGKAENLKAAHRRKRAKGRKNKHRTEVNIIIIVLLCCELYCTWDYCRYETSFSWQRNERPAYAQGSHDSYGGPRVKGMWYYSIHLF